MPDWASVLWRLDVRYFLIRGGRGSSKSRSVATALVLRAAAGCLRILCCREIQDSIKDSVKRTIDDEIARLGLGWFFTSTQTEIRGANGSLFIFAGLRSNVTSIKSMEGIDICWVEEAQTVSRNSLDVLIPTIRQPGSQLIFTWNPLNEYDAIETMFAVGKEPPGSLRVDVNYVDNPWFPDELRKLMEHHRATDLETYAHLWLGQFKKRSDALVFRNWSVAECEPKPGEHLRFGADWGYAQDPTVLIRCWTEGRTLYVDHEAYEVGCEIINLPELFMTVPLSEKFPVTADSSRPETISHMRKHFSKNIYPSVKGTGSVEDGIEFLRGFSIVVHPRCVHVIEELAKYSYKVDEANRVLPILVDKDNHCIAEGEQVLCERGYVPIEEVTTSDLVMTRAGWRPVLFADVTDVDRDIVRVTTTVGSFLCTPDHEVWTSKGFVRADALRYDDEVIGDTQWAILTTSKQLNGAGKCGAATQAASTCPTGATSSAWLATGPSGCTGLCGLPSMGQSPADTTSTTSTRTLPTTTLATCNASPHSSTSTRTHGAQSALSASVPTLSESDRSPRHGTPALTASTSTDGSVVWLMPTSPQIQSPASNAAPSLSLEPSATVTASVPTSASPPTAAPVASTTSNAFALVAPSSPPTGTASNRLVAGRVVTVQEAGRCARVYDLTVEEHHEFIVGGVLVSNCIDALRYACESARRTAAVARKAPSPPTQIASRW